MSKASLNHPLFITDSSESWSQPPPPPEWQWNGLKRLMSRALLSRHDEGNFPKLSASACMRDKPCLFLRTNQLNSNTQIIMYSQEADCRRHPWNNVAQNELRITYVNFSRLLTITENVVDFEGKLEEPALWIKKKKIELRLSEKELQQLNLSTSGKKEKKRENEKKKRKGSKEGGQGVWEQIKENSLRVLANRALPRLHF